MPTIEIPEVGAVDFPDTMSEQDITAAAAKLHKEHSATPIFQYAGLTAPMINPKKAEEVSNSITGQTGGMNRSSMPVIGDLIDGLKSLPDVQRGFHEQPIATAKGLFGGLLEGLTSITDPVSIASFGLPLIGKGVKAGAKIAQGASALAKDAKVVAPALSVEAEMAAKAAPAIERRAVTRVANSVEDAGYARTREKFATGAETGSDVMREVDAKKRALDASREVASKVQLKKPAAAPAAVADDITRLPGTRVVKKNILRPNSSTFDLAQEAMPNGIKLKALKKIPKPTGSDELSRALRQRSHISEEAAKIAAKKSGGEAGFATTGMMTELPKALLQARSASMLSGMALPMSIAGNVGAPVTAALESGSMKPIQELLRLPTNARNVIEAFKTGSNPSEMAQYGAKKMGLNLPGRAIGAFDTATQQLLQRAGVAPEEAKRLLLQGPNKIAEGLHDVDPHGIVFPFQKTPSNFFTEGVKSVTKPGSLKKAAITGAVTGAGYETGKHTDNKTALKTGAAMSGVRGIPFLIGAGIGAGQRGGSTAARKAMGSFSPIQDMGITSMVANPSIEGVKQATGLKPAFQSAFLDKEDNGRSRTRVRRRR